MIKENIEGRKKLDKIEVKCDQCGVAKLRYIRDLLKTRLKTNGIDLCKSCMDKRSIHKKPQCSKEYWTDDKKKSHGNTFKHSEKYIKAISNRDQSGSKNSMYGKKASLETRRKMSIARRGRIGPLAPAWKGGKFSLNRRVKRMLESRFKWFSSVLQRENHLCQLCGDTASDAHHIVPMSTIIRRELENHTFQTDDERALYLLTLDSIIDPGLGNGMALCRPCHRKEHKKWGSHIQ